MGRHLLTKLLLVKVSKVGYQPQQVSSNHSSELAKAKRYGQTYASWQLAAVPSIHPAY